MKILNKFCSNIFAAKYFYPFAISTIYFYASSALADASNVPDAGSMLANLSETVPQFMKLVTAMAYVMGMALIFRGLLALKQYGESRTMMSSQHELKGPLILMSVGTALLYLPTAVGTGLTTFWGSPNAYAYPTASSDQWDSLIQDCYLVVQLIGTVAFIRGLLTLTHLGSQAQPGTMSKGFTFIAAGALCINLPQFITAVENTLGITGVVNSS